MLSRLTLAWQLAAWLCYTAATDETPLPCTDPDADPESCSVLEDVDPAMVVPRRRVAVPISWNERAKLLASDMSAGSTFGNCVGVSGYVAVVGAPAAAQGGKARAGAAYVYSFDERAEHWVEEAILEASDAQAGHSFGSSVAISGDLIVVGAPYANPLDVPMAGAVYVFRYKDEAWVQESHLGSENIQPGYMFGSSVGLSGDVLIVGSHQEGIGSGSAVGAAYIYRRNGTDWDFEAKFASEDSQAEDYYGLAVGISEGVAVVGAFQEAQGSLEKAGAAYVYRHTEGSREWPFEQVLTADDKQVGCFFGSSISIDGDVIAIGAHGAEKTAGAAYVYRYSSDSWMQQAKIVPRGTKVGDHFGRAISVSGDVLAGGAPYTDRGLQHHMAGVVYVFRYDSGGKAWQEEAWLSPADANHGDYLGAAVCVSSAGAVLAGADGSDPEGLSKAGAVYIFTR